MPLAARAQVEVTHSTNGTIGTYTTLDEAISACTTTSGTYTIELTGDCTITDNVTMTLLVTIIINGNGYTVNRTWARGSIINKRGAITINDLTFDGHEYIFPESTPFDDREHNYGFLFNHDGTATLSNCTIQNVRFLGYEGGAVLNNGTLTMTNCIITNCGDDGVSYSRSTAGGVNSQASRIQVSPYSGFTIPHLTMTNCTISNCKTVSGSGADGVLNVGGDIIMEGCTIKECGVGGSKMACLNQQKSLSGNILYPIWTFRGTNHIVDNSQHNGIVNQGEILFEDGSTTYIQNNDASSFSRGGGGIRVESVDFSNASLYSSGVENYKARLTATGTAQLIISGNKAIEGGGIWSNGTIDFSGSGTKTITGNSATRFGGGFYLITFRGNNITNGVTTLANCTVGASDAPNTAKDGGGIYLCGFHLDGSLIVNGCSCTYNTATNNGGGVYIYDDKTASFDGTTIQYNTAGKFGGGVYVCRRAIMDVRGAMTVKGNTTTRSSATYNLYLKKSKEDDVCIQTLNDDPSTGNIGKIRLKGTIAGSKIGITEEQVASGNHRSLDANGNKMRQFTLDYGNYYSSKAARDVFFSNDSILNVVLLTHPNPGTTTGLREVTLGAELIRSWYIAGIVDDGGLTWGNDNNSGLAPDVPLRTLTGPQGVFAKGYNPLTDHIFAVRAVSAAAEAAAGRLTDGKVVVRYPNAATAATFLGNTTAIADESGSEEVILHRYPGGHRLKNGLADNGGATVAGQVASGSQNGPGANTGPVFAMDNTTNQARLYNIHMDGLREYSKEAGVTNADIDAIDPNHTHNPSYLRIDPASALLAVESGTTIALIEDCDLLLNDNKDGSDNSATLREKRTGGAVYCAGTLEMDTVTIVKSNCATNGGGVFVTTGGAVTLLNSLVGGNGATDKNTAVNGGGFYIDGTGTVTLNEGCRVTYNTATNQGGGIYINANAAMNINGSGTEGVLIKYNHSDKVGGGVYKLGSLRVGGLVVITDNTSSGTP
ncbi:MAG: right-handed parallel beta-helix repeat-containing protein [Bacteroidales bacterium]|nr:right-handed parallel beta-helix repeat-containing protein [Bacteroidales bacterium]